MELKTEGPEQTMRLGRVLGATLSAGAVVALTGDLGAGKTVLAKGIAQGLGVKDEREVTSPSFVLIHEYEGRVPVYHVDLYRLQHAEEVEDLGWDELFSGRGVTLLEWAEKATRLLPAERIEVNIQWISPTERKIVFAGKGDGARKGVDLLGEKWEKEE
ncbi:MAG TPA: tRNA (adenosine(37)-N6)-threonylcarbamoyltransferase complex ATPase subunit type 1 TsaE [Thermodesulfobacteriota bacterium]